MSPSLDAAAATDVELRPSSDEESLARAYQRETARLVRARLDLSLAFFLLFMGIVVLFERRMLGHERVTLAYAVELTIAVLATILTRVERFADATTTIAALATSGLALSMLVFSAMIRSPWDPVAIGQVCLMTCLAIVLPWGWRAQLLLTTVSVGGFVILLPSFETTTPVIYALVALMTSATTSCFAAFFLDRYRFQAFARAVELSRAYALQQEEAEISTALLHVGQMLSQFIGRSELLEQVNRMVIDALGCDFSNTFVFDQEQNAFRFVANVGSRTEIRTELENIDFPPDSMAIFAQLRRGRMVEIGNVAEQQLVPPELLTRWDVASLLCAPIHRNERLIGVIATGYVTRLGPFSRKQRRLLLGIGHAVSVGVDNERLIRDLRAANRLKSDFVATMSHELRTPLNVILGYAEMLGDGVVGPPHDVLHIAERIERSATELLELVNATLDLGRMESGRDVLQIEPVALAGLLAEIEAELDAVARTRGLPVRWRNTLGAITVPTDRVKFKTVLKNLVGNAIKYTPQGAVEVTAARSGDLLVLTVQDTGIGIGEADLPAIFEMFRQVDGSSTSTAGGVGLGLYIVRQLVERLNGSITVDSTPGVGSTFTVRVPMLLADTVGRPGPGSVADTSRLAS